MKGDPNMKRLPVGVLVTALVLMACGGGSSEQSLAQIQEQLAEDGIRCEGTPGPYQSHGGDDFSFGLTDPEEALECETPEGVEVEASRWGSANDRDQMLDMFGEMMCSFGSDVAFVRSGSALINITGYTLNKADHETLEKIAESLGTSVVEPCGEVDTDSLADSSGELGQPIDLGDGTEITLSNPRVAGNGQPHIEVDVTFTNESSTTARAPLPKISCESSKETGGWLAGSEYGAYEDAKPGETLSGMLQLLVPDDHRTGEATPECAAPAFFVVETDGAEIPVPEDLLDEFNQQARDSVGYLDEDFDY